MPDITQFTTKDELEARAEEIKADLVALGEEFRGKVLDDDAQERHDELVAEREAIVAAIAKIDKREEAIRDLADSGKTVSVERKAVHTNRDAGDIYDLDRVRMAASSPEEFDSRLRDNAMRSVETSHFPEGVNREAAQSHIANLLETKGEAVRRELSERILTTGSPAYRRAFAKALPAALKGLPAPLTSDEARALSVGTGSAGGFAVVYTLDPTVVPTSNFSVNPYRAISRVETIAGTNEWKAVTSGAITAAYAAEATEASDNAPTLAQPDIIVEKAQAYIPFSIEAGQDWSQLESEMAALLQDAKDDLEASKFATGAGHGSNEPKGVITGATSTVTAGGTAAFAIADLYALLEGLPARFRPRARFVGNLFTYDKVRQFDTAGGSGVWIGAPNGLQPAAGGMSVGTSAGEVGILLGRPAHESTAMASALTTGSKILLLGDFRYFVIVDRIGMNLEVVPLVVGTNHRPTGQRGLYAYWRNSSDVLSASAFRVLVTG